MANRPFESRIQDLVYNIEVGIGLQVVKVFLYILMMCGLAVLYMSTEYAGFNNREAMDYGQLARNFSEKGRLETDYIRPASMWFLMQNKKFEQTLPDGTKVRKIENHPDIVHAPGFPVVLGTVFKFAKPPFDKILEDKYPPEQMVIVPVNLFFSFMAALFLFLLGRLLFDPRVALTGTTIFFLSNTVWADALSGTERSMALFLATFAMWGMVKTIHLLEEPGTRWFRWVPPFAFACLAAAGLFLTRYAAITFLPALFFVIWVGMRKRGWIFALILLLVFAGGSAPWLMRNMKVCGTMFGLAPHTALMDENRTFERSILPDMDPEQISSMLNARFMNNIGDLLVLNDGGVGNALLMAFFVVTFFYKFQRRTTRLVRWGVLISWILMTLVGAVWGSSAVALQHIFLPIIILFSTAFFFILLDRMQITVKVVSLSITALFVLMQAVPMIFTITPPRPGNNYPPYNLGLIKFITEPFKEDELICSDMPWATAWYGQKNSLDLPLTLDEFYEVNDYMKRISLLYFTPLTRDLRHNTDLKRGVYRTWHPITEFRLTADFPLRNPAQLMNGDQIILSDNNRWATGN